MIKWEFSLEAQEKYYQEITDNLLVGRFQQMGFYVLPYLPEKFRVRVVYFPRKADFGSIYKYHKREIEKLEAEFGRKKEYLEELVSRLCGGKVVEVVISVQLTGTMGSFDIDGDRVVVRPRFDRSWMGLVKLVVRALTKYVYVDLDNIDLQKKVENNCVELGLSGKSLPQILYRNLAGKYIEESCDYLKELGFDTEGGEVDFNKITLTKKERLLINLLLSQKNKLVGWDKIAETIWGEKVEEKYSLYAISKLIDRLRRKIYESCGRNLIHPQRGAGYVLQG